MKHFLISLLLFSLLVVSLAFNAYAVNKKTKEMTDLVLCLPDTPTLYGADGIKAYWDENRGFFSMSLNTSELERTDEYISELYAACRSGDGAGYRAAKAKAYDAVRSLDDGERIDFLGIF